MKKQFAAVLLAFGWLTGCAEPGALPPPQPEHLEAPPDLEIEPREEILLSGDPDRFTLAWPQMQQADFWIELVERPQEARMTAEEIAAYNASLCGLPGTGVEDLSSWPERLTAAQLQALLDEYPAAPGGDTATQGGPITQEQRRQIEENRNLPSIQPANPVRYGFAVQDVILRSYPSGLPVFDGPDRTEYDLAAETALKIWEPLLVLHASADGQWLLVRAYDYLGWAPAEQVALCSRDTWSSLRQRLSTDFLTVIAPRLALDGSFSNPGQEALLLKMGARLPLTEGSQADNASAENCYLVQLPLRREDGTLTLIAARIPRQEEVVLGSLPFTTENLLRQAFRLLGHRYGWGGTAQGWDCSSMCQDIYRTMGFDLPRNASSQGQMPGSLSLEGLSLAEKTDRLAGALPGAMLEMPGHQTLLVGTYQGQSYVLHATYGVYDDQGGVYTANSVILTSSAALRQNGRSLLENGRRLSLPDLAAGGG